MISDAAADGESGRVFGQRVAGWELKGRRTKERDDWRCPFWGLVGGKCTCHSEKLLHSLIWANQSC